MSYKRIVASYILILAALFLCALRVSSITLNSKYSQAANEMTARKIVISNQRGTIYDCNLKKLTNDIEKYVVLITENPKAINMVSEYFSGDETIDIINEIRKNKYAIRYIDKPISCEGLVSFPLNLRMSNDSMAKHIIGYLNNKNEGASGLEAAFNEILSTNKEISLNVGIDGKGNVLLGSVKLDDNNITEGIVTTIDKEIQSIVEQAATSLACGAVVVVDITNGNIKALTSRPDFNPVKIGDYLTDESAPLINRALLNYNVGSVFKPCVAAAALESGYDSFIYDCRGYSNIDGLSFHCHKLSGHGMLDLSDAIKFSCNTYFYNFAINLGAEKIFNMAEKAGFNSSVYLGPGLYSAKGNIGHLSKIEVSKRAIANLSIGQGDLMLSPVLITNLYSAIANEGVYYPPTIYKGRFSNYELIKNDEKATPIRLMSKDTADILKKQLCRVLDEDGTGNLANPNVITAAGKTGTAQTGIIRNGSNVTNTWFCGFFPFENPRYVVSVLAENTEKSCAGVFAEIVNNMYS